MNLLTCLSGFNIIFFFIFWGTDRGVVGFPSSLVFNFFFPVQIPLRYVFNMSICLNLPYQVGIYQFFFNIEKFLRKNEIKRKCLAV